MQVRAFFPGVTAPLLGGSLETGVNYISYTSTLRCLQTLHTGPWRPSSFGRQQAPEAVTNLPLQQQPTCKSQPASHNHLAASQNCEHVEAKDVQASASNALKQQTLAQVTAAAAVAGVSLSFILGPVELIKCRMQVSTAFLPLQMSVTMIELALIMNYPSDLSNCVRFDCDVL